MYEAKMFLDKKQDKHFEKFGVYADVNSKIAEWMQEYADEVVKKLTIPDVVIRSELLAFMNFLFENWQPRRHLTADMLVDAYLKANCG